MKPAGSPGIQSGMPDANQPRTWPMPQSPRPDHAAVALWLSAQLSASFDHVLAEAIPDELLRLAAGPAEHP